MKYLQYPANPFSSEPPGKFLIVCARLWHVGHRIFGRLCVPKTSSVLIWRRNHITTRGDGGLLSLFLNLLISPLKSTSRLEAENAALRQQLVVLQRKVRGRIQFAIGDRLSSFCCIGFFSVGRIAPPIQC